MRLLKYIVVPWTIFFIYFLFSAILGQNGLYARKHLDAEVLQLTQNLNALERENEELLKIKDSLQNDRDALMVYMRKLGYGRDGEQFIRIMGQGIALNSDMLTGQVLYAANHDFVQDKTLKIIAICIGLAVFMFLFINDIYQFKTRY
ncbi:MAG: septum formation initiator family protein [Treponema sp.]|nr:septum formation initiator family protein [Treponema sp.]